MLTRDEIGQLFTFGFRGKTFDAETERWLAERRPGGVIYFARNAGSPEECRELTASLQAAARKLGMPPLLVSVDQEGGTVARLTDGWSVFPSNMAFGAIWARDAISGLRTAAAASSVVARELERVGINVNLAPCLDVNTNPLNPVVGVRSYSSKAAVVAELGTAAVMGYAGHRVAATVKHFPGHGDTSVDSHLGLPVVTWDLKFEMNHILPFKAAIKAGVPVIMTSHIVFEKGDGSGRSSSGTPVTLSRDILMGYLRGVLGFDGLIVTDCMEMAAITELYGTARASVMALKAGADMVMVSHTYDLQEQSIDAVCRAIDDGELDEREVRAHLRRIAALKARLAKRAELVRPASEAHGETMPGIDAGAAPLPVPVTPIDVAARSITLLRRDLQPSRETGTVALIAPERYGSTLVEDIRSAPLGKCLAAKVGRYEHAQYSQAPAADQTSACASVAARAGLTVFVSNNLYLSEARSELLRQVIRACPNTVLLEVGAPFDTFAAQQAPYVICSYGYAPVQIEAAIDVIFSDRPPLGVLPVDIPGQYAFGYGLNADGKVIVQ